MAATSSAELTPQRLAEWRKQFQSKPAYRLMQNALTQTGLADIALSRDVITGTDHTFSHRLDVIDTDQGPRPRRWRVENSWGEKNGRKGFYVMNDSWFGQYLFEIAARKRYLPKVLRQAAEQKPIVLPAWDPMGSLAR